MNDVTRVTLTRQQKMVSHMAGLWFKEFAKNFKFPSNYTCIDIETSGLFPQDDFICSVGYCVVRDHAIVDAGEHYLDWTRNNDVDHADLKKRLQKTQNVMEGLGKGFYHTYDILAKKGDDPVKVLSFYLDMFERMEQDKEVLVAHNGWAFDIEFLKSHFHNWLRVAYTFSPSLVYDSGVIEKASQLHADHDPLPLPNESLMDFTFRIAGVSAGARWGLDSHCENAYKLSEKMAGCEYFTDGADHQAGYDATKVHFLIEEHRLLSQVGEV